MNHCVPDFDIEVDDDEYPIPSSGLPRAKKSSMPDDEIMELLWQNGQVVMQSQNQRSPTKPTPTSYPADAVIPAGPSTVREVRSSQHPEVENLNYQNQQLFMQEDEMTSWLHYPIVDDTPLDHNFCADLLYPPPTANNNNNTHTSAQNFARTSQVEEFRKPSRLVGAPRPPIPPARRTEPVQTKIQNFAHFSKHNARVEPAPSSSKNVMKESTVVDSSDTPAAAAAVSRISETVRNSAEPTDIETGRGNMSSAGVAEPSATSAGGGTGGREVMTCEMTVTSSPGGSSASAEPAHRAPAEDRKRKGREADNSECRSEDVDFEPADVRKQARGSTSNKRSRAAEVHNLSERRRRDRINEKMRALQELIPRCNKSDKASMLDEAIEYLKSLQLQVQMMSMGCGMVPMMFPGLQQYMAAPPMGMGIGMGVGMGMGMEMGMNRPVMPFPNILGGSALPAATVAAAHLGPRFPVPPFRMPPNASRAPDSSRMQAANQADPPMLNSPGAPAPNQLRIPNFGDPYQQYLGPYQMQFQLMQNQAINQPNVNQPSSSKDNEKLNNHKSEGT